VLEKTGLLNCLRVLDTIVGVNMLTPAQTLWHLLLTSASCGRNGELVSRLIWSVDLYADFGIAHIVAVQTFGSRDANQ
jgi:hypothetical protein